MNFLTPGTGLVFVGNAGVGQNMGQTPPQVKSFDVYYAVAPIVGFHIVAAESEEDE
jgi:hypothetical protein